MRVKGLECVTFKTYQQAQRILDLEAQLRASEIVVTSLEATWGFEAFCTLVLHPNLFDFEAKSVKSDFLPVPEAARNELHYMGEELFPDVLNWAKRMGFPTDHSLPQFPLDVSESGDESYDTAGEDSGNCS